MAEHDDWDADWDDDEQDVEPYVPASEPPAAHAPAGDGDQQQSPARDDTPTTQTPAAAVPPEYDDEDRTGEAADYDFLDAPPVEEFVDRPTVARSRNRPTRARAVSQSGERTDLPPVQGIEPEPAPDGDDAGGAGGARGCLIPGVVIVLVVAILAAMAWALITMGPLSGLLNGDDDEDGIALPNNSTVSSPDSSSSAPTSSASAGPSSAAEAADEECADSASGTTAGNGPGSRDSGPDVILAFDHAYYVDRNGTKARGYMNDDITGTTAKSLQEAIDELPEETAHCLKIRPKDDEEDVYLVDLIVFRDQGDEIVRSVDEQTIYVDENDGEYSIVGIINPE